MRFKWEPIGEHFSSSNIRWISFLRSLKGSSFNVFLKSKNFSQRKIQKRKRLKWEPTGAHLKDGHLRGIKLCGRIGE